MLSNATTSSLSSFDSAFVHLLRHCGHTSFFHNQPAHLFPVGKPLALLRKCKNVRAGVTNGTTTVRKVGDVEGISIPKMMVDSFGIRAVLSEWRDAAGKPQGLLRTIDAAAMGCAPGTFFVAEHAGRACSRTLQPTAHCLERREGAAGEQPRRGDAGVTIHGQQGFANVRYAFNGDRMCASQRTEAMCH